MATPFPSICATCWRRMTRPSPTASWAQYRGSQVRGKKKNAKAPTSIDVRLIKDLPGYGRKGAIVPLPIGQMRNFFYPQRFADYVTWTEGKQLKKAGVAAQRDFSFGKDAEKDAGAEIKGVGTSRIEQPARATRRSQPMRVDLDRLKPQESFDAITRILPLSMNFYRAPIDQADIKSGKTPQPSSTAIPGPSASLYPTQTNNIYGSVTTADVATNLKALLATDEETGGRVMLGEQDIRFVSGSDDSTRAKHLGDFVIEINIKGINQPVRRTVRVLPEEDAPGDLAAGQQAINELAAEQPLPEDAPEAIVGQDADVGAILDQVEGSMQDTRQLMNDVKDAVVEGRMTPAEAAERQAFGNAEPNTVEREGVLLEDVNDEPTPRPTMDHTDIR